jgi:6-pyruvoyltetrahydropterin/6-carboxytetrahydropterin synthase
MLPGHPKCGQLHGHTYKVEVVIEGEIKDGMLIDFADMKAAINRILNKYDHKSLNDFLDYPTVENICQMLHDEMQEALPFTFSIRVWEGDGKWAEI